jgi:hypothetical protein
VIGCVKKRREDSTLCFFHRGQIEGTTEMQDGCEIDGCHRRAAAAGRCKVHRLKFDAVAQAA